MSDIPFDEDRRLADLHFRAGRLEQQIKNFSIGTDGGSIYGGFSELKSDAEDIHERINNIESAVAEFRLSGGAGLTAVGTFSEGYIITGRESAVAISIPAGACCHEDGTCTFGLASSCIGIYLGDGTFCSSNLCPKPGKCCHSDGTCTHVLEAVCAGSGGTFTAGGVCIPNTCPQPGACCEFDGTCNDNVLPANCAGVFFGAHELCANHTCCGPKGIGVSAQGLSCISANGSDHTSSFLVSAGASAPATQDAFACCEAVLDGLTGHGTNLGIEIDFSVSVIDTGGGTFSLTVTGTLTDTNGSSTPFPFTYTYSGICGSGGFQNEHPTKDCGSCTGTSGSGNRCSSGYCGSGCDYIWLLTEVGGGITISWT